MELKDIRNKIDVIDDKILDLFIERMEISKDVVKYKKENGLPILNKERERQILKDVQEKAGEYEEYAYQLFSKLMELSKASQREIISGNTKIKKAIDEALLSAEKVFPKTLPVRVLKVLTHR